MEAGGARMAHDQHWVAKPCVAVSKLQPVVVQVSKSFLTNAALKRWKSWETSVSFGSTSLSLCSFSLNIFFWVMFCDDVLGGQVS